MNEKDASKPAEQRLYKGSRHAITRPDWPTKHDDSKKARNLLAYILNPSNYPDRIIRDSSNAVIIEDKYPKAQVHLLVLPKWQPHRDLHPHDAFEDLDFLSMVREEVEAGLKAAIPKLRTKMHDALLQSGLDANQATSILEHRDFSRDFHIGIHAHPSQHELHVHVMSRDMVSWHDYGSRHYQAFNTPFLVPLNLYPLPLDDIRREVQFQNANLMKDDYQCWRCGKYFGTDWGAMKMHLQEEFLPWIREGYIDGIDGVSYVKNNIS